MIRALRRRHRAIWIGLAIVLPILLYAALRARRATPTQELPATLAPHAAPADDAGSPP